jgi:hypothetical protein
LVERSQICDLDVQQLMALLLVINTWSSMLNLLDLPLFFARTFSAATTFTICSNVPGVTPLKRLNSL